MNNKILLGGSFGALVVMNVLDFITTKMLIDRQDYTVESNIYLLKWMQSVDSTYPILIAKAIPLLFFGLALIALVKKEPQHIRTVTIVINLMNVMLLGIVGMSIYCLV